jgi:hypothetical protein
MVYIAIMIFRYTFPVPDVDSLVRISLYVETDGGNPTKAEVLDLLGTLKSESDTDGDQQQSQRWAGCIYALKHAYGADLPRLPIHGIKGMPVFCELETGQRSSIQINMVEPRKLG